MPTDKELAALALCEILEQVQLTISNTEVLLNNDQVHEKVKHFMRSSVLRRLTEIKLSVTMRYPQIVDMLRTMIFNEEQALQQHEIMIRIKKLDEVGRDKLENFLETLEKYKG